MSVQIFFFSPSSTVVEFVDCLLFDVVDPFAEDIVELVLIAIVKVVVALVGIEGLVMTSGFPFNPF